MFGKQLFEIAVCSQKALFENAIFISLFKRTFCGNDVFTQDFKQITLHVIALYLIIYRILFYKMERVYTTIKCL